MKTILKAQTPNNHGSTIRVFGLYMLIIFSISCTSNNMNDKNPEIQTVNGIVRGFATNNYAIFQGIPYAKPPVGELRWKSPQPIDNWSGIKETVIPAPKCMQLAGGPGSEIVGSEDCLYLNVTKPASASRMTLKPVIVELHGGGFHSGSGAEMDARRLAVLGNVVVVTINYRLGVFDSIYVQSNFFVLYFQMAKILRGNSRSSFLLHVPCPNHYIPVCCNALHTYQLLGGPLHTNNFKV